ncbi:hypothetical protein ACFWD7_08095 [Streptomyces mirabilis]|uniref:hypothetical protein n=1 Tax=Streptomyces mirabilis TaxID=68239 RepID=UPI0021BE34DC|nr:hypothetical protein [Streptomyces mirabilis]MCT9108675.1 hypothetical protein [Streptomyces mirabilis]
MATVLPGDEPPTRPAARPAPAAPGWKGFKQLRATQVVPETPTASSFLLRPVDSQALPLPRPASI